MLQLRASCRILVDKSITSHRTLSYILPNLEPRVSPALCQRLVDQPLTKSRRNSGLEIASCQVIQSHHIIYSSVSQSRNITLHLKLSASHSILIKWANYFILHPDHCLSYILLSSTGPHSNTSLETSENRPEIQLQIKMKRWRILLGEIRNELTMRSHSRNCSQTSISRTSPRRGGGGGSGRDGVGTGVGYVLELLEVSPTWVSVVFKLGTGEKPG